MANRNYSRLQSLTHEAKLVFAKVTIAGTGAPTLVSVDSVGVTSITRNSAGLYTLVLDDRYNKLLGCGVDQLVATAEDLQFQIAAETVSASTKTVQFRCVAAGVATDPSSGSILYIKLALKNSSVVR